MSEIMGQAGVFLSVYFFSSSFTISYLSRLMYGTVVEEDIYQCAPAEGEHATLIPMDELEEPTVQKQAKSAVGLLGLLSVVVCATILWTGDQSNADTVNAPSTYSLVSAVQSKPVSQSSTMAPISPEDVKMAAKLAKTAQEDVASAVKYVEELRNAAAVAMEEAARLNQEHTSKKGQQMTANAAAAGAKEAYDIAAAAKAVAEKEAVAAAKATQDAWLLYQKAANAAAQAAAAAKAASDVVAASAAQAVQKQEAAGKAAAAFGKPLA
jgi:hypothetical protein